MKQCKKKVLEESSLYETPSAKSFGKKRTRNPVPETGGNKASVHFDQMKSAKRSANTLAAWKWTQAGKRHPGSRLPFYRLPSTYFPPQTHDRFQFAVNDPSPQREGSTLLVHFFLAPFQLTYFMCFPFTYIWGTISPPYFSATFHRQTPPQNIIPVVAKQGPWIFH